MFFSNDTKNNMWALRCIHWQQGNSGCPEENSDLFFYVKNNNSLADVVEQQNYLTGLGFNPSNFQIVEAPIG